MPLNIRRLFTATLVALAASVGISRAQTSPDVAVKSGQSVAFLGDSITQQGWGNAGGYVKLVVEGFKSAGIDIKPIPAGISGHKSNDMLARLDKDVISKKPDWMTVSCGVNDVWHGARGVPLEDYKKNMTEIVDKAQAAGIKVMILTATVIRETDTPENQKLKDYNVFLRQLAAEKKCLLADLNADMQKALADGEVAGKKRGNMLTVDGVHMNLFGNMMMARGILKSFGLSDPQLATAADAWANMSDTITIQPKRGLSLKQYQALEAKAAAEKTTVDAMISKILSKEVDALLAK